MHFFTLAVAAATAASAATIPQKRGTATAEAPAASSSGAFEFFGINESGAEFGNTNIPGVYGTDYTWYDLSTIDTWISAGMNIFRINLLMERLTPSGLTGALDSAYSGNLTQTVNYITQKGAYAIITPHNYGRFNNAIITDTSGFGTWWKNVAKLYASNSKVVFDTNNEYHDMDQSLVVNLNQAAINGIRAAGATSQYITPEGNAYTGAWSWTLDNSAGNNGATMGALTDPSNKLIYQMHQYLDSDFSGTSATCNNATALSDTLKSATAWLRANNKVGFLGEFAGGINSLCEEAITDGLNYMRSNADVWKGAAWWAAGPWWGTYLYSAEPTSGVAYQYVTQLAKTYGVKV
ncbi:glycoside hydrolase family 5 protein [Viridothelium virens]|uniref:cellulase n=1 Tax=Viridothelium virens TaxID=1048519 RepID=A0A6A6GV12_VIRVR|nr:glycoside hydrolase family 5 protein [Viridothelium virens]